MTKWSKPVWPLSSVNLGLPKNFSGHLQSRRRSAWSDIGQGYLVCNPKRTKQTIAWLHLESLSISHGPTRSSD